MSAHTPTPWTVDDGIFVVGADGTTILAGASTKHSVHHCAADAEFIVRAVNSHEDLLAVAQMCLPWTGTDYTAKYEALAKEFYRHTGMTAPDKHSAGFDGWSYEERRAKWDEWTAERIERQREQILAAIEKAVAS